MNNARLATFQRTKSMLGLRNKTLLDTIVFKSNGILIHGRLVPKFFTTNIDGVWGVFVMTTYPTRFVFATTAKYPIYVRNDEICAILVDNGFFHNRICTKPIETIKGHHSSGFKVIHVSFDAWKSIVVDSDVEVLMNLLPKTPFHNVVTIKFVPPDLGGDPPKPPRGVIVKFVQHVIPYYRPFKIIELF